jgi:hypothetical protein
MDFAFGTVNNWFWCLLVFFCVCLVFHCLTIPGLGMCSAGSVTVSLYRLQDPAFWRVRDDGR